MRRRRSILTAAFLSSVAFSPIIASCQRVETAPAAPQIFFSMADCTKAFNAETCAPAFAKAKSSLAATTPQFSGSTAKAQCEAQFGSGNCETRKDSSGNSVLVPLLAGMMMSNMLADTRRYDSGYYGSYDSQGYRRDRERDRPVGYAGGGAYVPPPSSSSYNNYQSPSRTYSSSSSTYSRTPTTSGSTRAYSGVTSRGGFGASAASHGGFSGG